MRTRRQPARLQPRPRLSGLGDDGTCGPLGPGFDCAAGIIQLPANPNPLFQTGTPGNAMSYMCPNGQATNDPASCPAQTDFQRQYNESLNAAGYDALINSWANGYAALVQQTAQDPRLDPAVAAVYKAATPPPAVVVPIYRPVVILENLTTGAASTIVAGRDQWRLSITGAAPNVPVSVVARKDGAESSTVYGYTDAGGNWALTGISNRGDVGQWSQAWKAGADPAGSVSFQIVEQSTPTQPPAVVVPVYAPALSFANLTTGDPRTVIAGRDVWRLSITGAAPNVPVSVQASKDGAPTSTVYGYTDAGGNWTRTGTSSSGDVGQWSQTWKAGADIAGSISFQIAAAPNSTSTGGNSTTSTGGSNSTTSTGGGNSTTSTGGGLIAALPDSIRDVAQQVQTAAADAPAWLWAAGAIGAALWMFGKKGKW